VGDLEIMTAARDNLPRLIPEEYFDWEEEQQAS
jgi:hypothetical protein